MAVVVATVGICATTESDQQRRGKSRGSHDFVGGGRLEVCNDFFDTCYESRGFVWLWDGGDEGQLLRGKPLAYSCFSVFGMG